MTLTDALIFFFACFAGTFAIASLVNDFRGAWNLYQDLKKGPRDDD